MLVHYEKSVEATLFCRCSQHPLAEEIVVEIVAENVFDGLDIVVHIKSQPWKTCGQTSKFAVCGVLHGE
jgi:hypothetical protein